MTAESSTRPGAVTVTDALALGRRLAADGLVPGAGRTGELWQLLVDRGSRDLAAVRALEPHLDAVAILSQAGDVSLPAALADPATTWGVFASEAGAQPLTAHGPVIAHGDERVALDGKESERVALDGKKCERVTLEGVKEWCSLAGVLDAALVTALDHTGARGLYAVDLRHPGVTVLPADWHAHGLVEIPSGPVRFSAVPATPVGGAGWYLSRPGFAWGGIGVAACWLGGAIGLARTLRAVAAGSAGDRPFTRAHLGAVDEHLHACTVVLADAARAVDAGLATGADGALLALRVRALVARTAEDVLRRVGHALGPTPLAKDAEHAKRVADLTLYLRQHHAERDDEALGRAVLAAGGTARAGGSNAGDRGRSGEWW